jgi:MYXO-CTERM domain-containing protein
VVFQQTGDFEVCERVTSKEGLTGVECKRHEVRDLPPQPSFSVLSSGCFFPWSEFADTSRVSGDDKIVKVVWDLGDGNIAQGARVTHTYELTGVYNVTMTVYDDDGQSASTYQLIFAVGSKECGVPPGTSKDEGSGPQVPRDGVSESNAVRDSDEDGIPDRVDSCPGLSNAEEVFAQGDLDKDGIGDSCDDDKDGDGTANDGDLCPALAETYATDLDGDKLGDSCDPDADGDGVDTEGNPRDVCPLFSDAHQMDMDQDGEGDACDSDLDGDHFDNAMDAFPLDPTEWADRNGNGIGDNRDFMEAEASELKGRGTTGVEVSGKKAPGVTPLLLLALVAALVVLRRRK